MGKELKRVVITGIGAVTPIGMEKGEIVERLKTARTGIKPISIIDADPLPVRFAGEASYFKPEDFMDAKAIRRNDRFIQMCLAASELAIGDAGLEGERLKSAGVAIGVGLGGLNSIEHTAFDMLQGGARKVGPFFVPSILANLASGQVSIKYGIQGPNFAVSSACASGSQAIGQAFREIQAGRRDLWLAGGAEAPITGLSIAGFAAAKALSRRNDEPEQASRPFDTARDGFVLGEGSAVLVLESLESAQARGAKIYAEVIGFGMASDGYHITEPDPTGQGAFLAMQEAVADAGIDVAAIDYVNAHATSTPAGDKVEAVAMKRIFGSDSDVFVSSTKSLTGHLCGAAGAMEAVFCTLMLDRGFVAPTCNLDSPCPEFTFKAPRESDLDFEPKMAMNNSFGFGGINTSMLLAKHVS